MASYDDNKRFRDSVIGELLDSSIEWIDENMSPDDVFDVDKIIDFVQDTVDIDDVYATQAIIEFVHETCTPEEVFSVEDLSAWAEENGWMKKPH